MSSDDFRSEVKCYCPKCGAHVKLQRGPPPPRHHPALPAPDAMWAGICACGRALVLALTDDVSTVVPGKSRP